MTVLSYNAICVIPAKGHSTRIPEKNRKLFHGKPILAYSIEAAQQSEIFNRIVVSTDDAQIANLAYEYGASAWKRTAELCTDDIGPNQVTAHVIRAYPTHKWACCIYPCAPLITPDDLREAARIAQENQETPYSYVYAEGQFYYGLAKHFVTDPDNFENSYRMESRRYIDINTQEDWDRAEKLRARCSHDEGYGMIYDDMPEKNFFRCKACGMILPT